MNDGATPTGDGELAGARDAIARLTAENAALRRQLGAEHFAQDLRRALVLAATTGTIGSPVSHDRLLELIVQTAAQVINARAAHLFLIDEDMDELVFEVAVGPQVGDVEQRRVPLTEGGLAGLVALGGHPMTVADAREDPSLASHVAQFLGYVPDSILCVPLFVDQRSIGVLELLDKEGDDPFTNDDIAKLSLFANQAAIAITQSRAHGSLAAMMNEVLMAMGDHLDETIRLRARTFAPGTGATDDVDFREAMELAQLVQEIAWQGETEHQACLTILRGFAEYLRRHAKPTGRVGGAQ